jgi:hypothetical protein
MICKELLRYDRDELGKEEFAEHAARCPECDAALRLDEDLLQLASALRKPVKTSGLWRRIKKSLIREMRPDPKRIFPAALRKTHIILPAAAALLAVVLTGIFYFKTPSLPPALLTDKALAKVEKREQQYIRAIENLQTRALNHMDGLNTQLVLLYHDRLSVIDAQIKECRSALEFNPSNSHIRHYLMEALRNKKETLAEILGLDVMIQNSRRRT